MRKAITKYHTTFSCRFLKALNSYFKMVHSIDMSMLLSQLGLQHTLCLFPTPKTNHISHLYPFRPKKTLMNRASSQSIRDWVGSRRKGSGYSIAQQVKKNRIFPLRLTSIATDSAPKNALTFTHLLVRAYLQKVAPPKKGVPNFQQLMR